MESCFDFDLGLSPQAKSFEAMVVFEDAKYCLYFDPSPFSFLDTGFRVEFLSYLLFVGIESMIDLYDAVMLGLVASSSQGASRAILGLV